MPEDLKLSQISSSQLLPPFRGLHYPRVRKHCQIIFACYFRKSSVDDCICTCQLHCHSQIPWIYKLAGGMDSNSLALSGQHYCPEGTEPTPGLAFWYPSSKLPQLVILSVEGALHVTVSLSWNCPSKSDAVSALCKMILFFKTVIDLESGKGK